MENGLELQPDYMEEVSTIISLLEKNVRELVKNHADLKRKNGKLVSDLSDATKVVETQKETIKSLEEKNKIIKLAKSLSDSNPNTVEMKYKINELVREIDKCIAQMNS